MVGGVRFRNWYPSTVLHPGIGAMRCRECRTTAQVPDLKESLRKEAEIHRPTNHPPNPLASPTSIDLVGWAGSTAIRSRPTSNTMRPRIRLKAFGVELIAVGADGCAGGRALLA